MAKYRVTTDGGTFEVTTDEPSTPARPATSGSMALDFMQGGGAELIGTALGAYNLLRKIPGADKVLPPVSPEVQQYAEPPHTVAAKLGGIFTQLGEFAVPAGEAAGLTKGAGLLARSGAQAAAAGGVEAARSGGDIDRSVGAAALGAAGPVLGAGAQALAPIVRRTPGLVFDATRLAISPNPANALRLGQRIFGLTGKAAEEAAPASAAAASPQVADTLLDQVAQGFGAKDFSSMDPAGQLKVRDLVSRMNTAAPSPAAAPKPYTPRPPEYYGVKATEAPPENPAPSSAPAAQPPAAPTPKVQPIREAEAEPATEEAPAAPRPTAAAAAKSSRYADAISKWGRDHGLSVRQIADQWENATPEIRGQITIELKRKGYLGANETIPNTSANGIVEALKARSATIRPPAGFSMGAMKQYPAEPIAAPAEAPAPAPAAAPLAEATPKPAVFQYKGFLGTLGDAERENLFTVMREYGNKAQSYAEQHARLRPRYGEIAVGGAHMDPLINQYAIEAVSREISRGATIEDAIAAAKQEAKLTVQNWNKSRGDYQVHRYEGAAGPMLEEYGRRLRAALAQ